MQDTYRHKGMRFQLVLDLREKGITDERILAAMNDLPRHFFLEKAFEEWAYQDKAFPIGFEQTISQPFTAAYQTSLLQPKPSDKVLEIGTGSGYQAALLAMLCHHVYTLERQEGLFWQAQRNLAQFSFNNINCIFGDGYVGLPKEAPFHKILLTAGAFEIPEILKKQLHTEGGVLVAPIGSPQKQKMYRITRTSENTWKEEIFGNFRFVPFLKGVVLK